MKKKIFAFTLAEVLITLSIIGLVAEMTIPVLYSSYRKQRIAIQLKKIYVQGNLALQQLALEGGCPGDLNCAFKSIKSTTDLGTSMQKYYKIQKNCALTGRCGYAPSAYAYTLADGTTIGVRYGYTGAPPQNKGPNHMKELFGWFFVDLNGPKGPDKYGENLFLFWITNGKGPFLYPAGGREDRTASSPQYWTNGYCSATYKTWCCTGRVVEEGWQVTY